MRTLQFPDVTIDLSRRTVAVSGDVRQLTEREVQAIAYLADRAGEVVSRKQVERDVWGFRAGVRSQAVPVAMRRIRAKIEPDPSNPRILLTVQGVGWKLLPAQQPAVRAAFSPLPTFATSYQPRPELEAQLAQRIAQGTRILTVVGSGGAGKTRLAMQVLSNAPRPVCAVDLSQAKTDAQANALLLTALDQVDTSDLANAVSRREPFILLLDNLEHLMERAVHWAVSWLPELPNVQTVCTSREALRVPGEVVVDVPPMPTEQAAAFFEMRARESGALIPHHAAKVIATHLDGLPLALELYAAHAGLFSANQLVKRVKEGIDMELARRGTTDRLASLHGTMAWSWSLLSAEEQSALAQCAVFPGSFDVGAATTVLHNVSLLTLASLHRKSLLMSANGRFTLLRAARSFLQTQDGTSLSSDLMARHATWAIQTAHEAIDRLQQQPKQAGRDLEAIRGDLAQAAHGDTDQAAQAALVLVASLAERGMPQERLALLQRVRPTEETQDTFKLAIAQAHFDALDLTRVMQALDGIHRPDAMLLRARTQRRQGEPDAALNSLRAVAVHPDATPLVQAQALTEQASLLSRTNQTRDAFSQLAAAMQLCTRFQLHKQRQRVGLTMASIQAMNDQLGEAEDTLRRVLSEAQELELERAVQGAHHIIAYVLFERDPSAAAAHLAKAVDISGRAGDTERELTAAADLGVARWLAGDLESASERLEHISPLLPPLGPETASFYTLMLCFVRIERGRFESVERLLERVDVPALDRMLHTTGTADDFVALARASMAFHQGDDASARRTLALLRGSLSTAPRMVRIAYQHISERINATLT